LKTYSSGIIISIDLDYRCTDEHTASPSLMPLSLPAREA
jgi:hypothetical protein